MPGESDESSQAANGQPHSSASHLPWHLIPTFEPGETDLQDYARRLEFLAGLWPAEHLNQLAPRAALLCKGSAFQRIMRIAPEKLKVGSDAGVKLIVQTLGGVWGKTTLEDKFEKFERAVFGLSQKGDESNESYIARHDVIYEDLITQGVSFSDLRAYLLLRNSALQSDDKKRVIVEAKGDLKYDAVVSAIRMLGAKFFHDVQGQQKTYKSKVYDVNHVQEAEEEAYLSEEMPIYAAMDVHDQVDNHLDQLLAEGDEDALVCQQFEDALIDTMQSDSEMCAFVNTYMEARRKLTEKTKSRGFWPIKGSGKQSGKKGKGKGKAFFPRARKPLAVRIAESRCKICDEVGHWKFECPKRGTSAAANSNVPRTQTANVLVSATDLSDDDADVFVVQEIDEALTSDMTELQAGQGPTTTMHDVYTCLHTHGHVFHTHADKKDFYNSVCQRLQCILPITNHQLCADRSRRCESKKSVSPSVKPMLGRTNLPAATTQQPVVHDASTNPDREMPKMLIRKTVNPQVKDVEQVFFATSGAIGIVDLGASQTVMGQHQAAEFVQSLPGNIRDLVYESPIHMSFRFGNNSVVECTKAMYVPVDKFWIRIAIVPSQTPFLISNNVCRSLGAVIDTEDQTIFFKKLGCTISMTLSGKKLFLMDLCDLLAQKPPKTQRSDDKAAAATVLTWQSETENYTNDQDNQYHETNTESPANHTSTLTDDSRIQITDTCSPPTIQSSSIPVLQTVDHGDSCDKCLHGDEESGRSICIPLSQGKGQSSSLRGTADGHELRTGGQTDHEVRPSQSGSTVCQGSPGGSQVLPMVPQPILREQESRACGIHPLPQDVDRTSRAREGCESTALHSDIGQSPSKAQGQDGGHPTACVRGAHRSGSRGRGGALACGRTGVPDQHDGDTEPSPTEPAGGYDDRGGQPIACSHSESHCDSRNITNCAETFMIDQCIEEINHAFSMMGIDIDKSEPLNNWVYHEMKQYLKHRKRLTRTPIDVLEVYCSSDSNLTALGPSENMRTKRFGLKEGDLKTYEGRCRLYDVLSQHCPKNIWVSPKCTAWCKWSQFNVSRSSQTAQKIIHARTDDQVHLLLCDALFQWQKSSGTEYHFHLEQPVGSDMLYQDELRNIISGTHMIRCDQCVAGKLVHPENQLPIQKGTQILTTSTILARYLEKQRCPHDHIHAHVAGNVTLPSGQNVSLSSYTELYTRTFARKILRAFRASRQVHELSIAMLSVDDQTILVEGEEEPSLKRRRLNGKQSEFPSATEAVSSSSTAPSLHEQVSPILQEAIQIAPRVGKAILEDGPLFDRIQNACPRHHVRVIELCKGTDRYRKPPIRLAVGEAPLRCSFGLHRHSLEPTEIQPWTIWEGVSNRKLCSHSPPVRIMVTIFARDRHDMSSISTPTTDSSNTRKRETEDNGDEENKRHCHPDRSSFDKQNTTQQETDTDAINRICDQVVQSTNRHGPKFKSLSKEEQNWLSKIHHNLGHPATSKLRDVLVQQGVDDRIIQGLSDFQCSTCQEVQAPKVSRPASLPDVREFNDCVGCDLITWTSAKGKNFVCMHFIDVATNFQLAIPVYRTDTEALFSAFQECWLRWAGPCKQLVIDNESALCSEQFAQIAQGHDIHLRVVAAYAHWQLGKTERHGDILQHMLQKYDVDQPVENDTQFKDALLQCCNAKNSLSRVKGYTPEILVLGKSTQLPGNLCEDQPQASHYLADSPTPEGLAFRQQLLQRECARKAFVQTDHSEKLRRAFLRRQRPHRGFHNSGSFVMFWRPGKGDYPGQWHGPARVIVQEAEHVIWLSHSSRVFRVAPEHVRQLSEREAIHNFSAINTQHLQPPNKDGRGVFQYEDLTDQVVQVPPIPMPPAPDVEDQLVEPLAPPDQIEHQPDSEPSQPDHDTSDYAPTTPMNTNSEANPEDNNPNPADIPVPSSDDELYAEDYWVHHGNQLLRVHRKPRERSFDPSTTSDCPVPILLIQDQRETTGNFGDEPLWHRQDVWGQAESDWLAPRQWTGITMFTVLNPADCESVNVTVEDILHIEENQMLEYEIFLTEGDIETMCQQPNEFLTLAASAAKRQRAEVKVKDMTAQDKKDFQKAKEKELDQWLATETVRKILRDKIPTENILRCRWVLTWKDLDAIDAAKEGRHKKAKARLVILGYEDPNICDIPRDSPTLQKESRALLFQLCAARKLQIRSFDIKTAFLRGSRRDTRILGIEPPDELRDKLKLQDNEICELLKSAYGLVNAPYLWYQELKETLLSLNFTISPLDPCLFVLANEKGFVHGAIGMHVDDGLCFGDAVFDKALELLEAKFPFGSKREGSFTFTGIQVHQDQNWNIHLSQEDYVLAIDPIHIDRNRRKLENENVTESERQGLRGLIGSLQYASTNTRPDIAARLSFIQSKITTACIADLLEANRMLGDAKKYSSTSITISSIPEDQIRLVSYSDASFASRAKQQSQKGGLFLAVQADVFQQKSAVASPLTWHSKKIDRVVASTLASETYALSNVVDTTNWLRLMWEWLRNPLINWRKPEEVWKKAPPSIAVMDCKSLYDVLVKNTTPQCQEHRTLIEALVIKEHVKHGIKPHWVHSAAQLADALTKVMDCFRLREFLQHRTCCLHDVESVLKERADNKARKNWLSGHAIASTPNVPTPDT